MTQVLLVGPLQMSRDALCSVLANSGDISVRASAPDYETSVDAVCRHEIDVVVIDIAGMVDPMAIISDLQQIRPGLHTLVLASTAEVGGALMALGAGVQGYVTKQDDSSTLLTAIRSVASGTRYVSPAVGWHVAMKLLQAFPPVVAH